MIPFTIKSTPDKTAKYLVSSANILIFVEEETAAHREEVTRHRWHPHPDSPGHL